MILYLQILLFLFQPSESNQPLDRWLLKLIDGDAQCLEEWWLSNGLDRTNYLKKKLPIEYWMVIEIPPKYSNSLFQIPCIESVNRDEKLIQYNTIPNDPDFYKQMNLEMVEMSAAWDITKGGQTFRNDTIVIAVIDDGFQTNHEDIVENLWFNRKEIQDDGIDNDSNGYIDDYYGVNITTGTDDHPKLSHGISVAGIIGATGNNGKGICGINWHVKLMLLSYNHHVSELAEAYQYVLDMRKKYNETHGLEGAFVVAVNLSAGINYALPKNFPLWCSMYDKLGAEGILSVCTAPNISHSVDINGGMPSRCTSPYTINVTNVNSDDEIMEIAGFGRISIDIGAPGEGSLTTDTNYTYNIFNGTSAAAPYVTGTIALIYSLQCQSFFEDLDNSPDALALRIKNVILSSGEANNSLQNITLTGKRLQVNSALKIIMQNCDKENNENISIRFITPNPAFSNSVRLYFESMLDTMNTTFNLYTINGVKMESFTLHQEEYTQGFADINIRSLSPGIYLIVMQNRNQSTISKLIILN